MKNPLQKIQCCVWQPFTLFAGTIFTVLCCATNALAGQGTAGFVDFNGNAAGFGTATDTAESATNWTTSAAGTATTVARASGGQLTVGAVDQDFTGPSRTVFAIALDGGGSLQGVLINSTNVDVTFTGNSNTHNNSTPNTWTITNQATLTVNQTRQALDSAATVKGFNWNNVAVTFRGGGTFNFPTPFGCNSTAANVENMLPSGVINLSFPPISSTSSYKGGFTLTSGTLNFASAGSAFAFSGLTNGQFLALNGGTIDNTSFAPLTLAVGTLSGGTGGKISIGGNINFIGSSSLDFGTTPVTNSVNSTVTVGANSLSIGGVINGLGGFTKIGNGALVLYGANTYSGSTLVGAGALILTNSGSLASSALTVTNSTLNVSGASAALTFPSLSISNSTLVMAGSLVGSSVTVPTLSAGGTTNIVNISALPLVSSYPTVIHLIQATTVTGTLNFGLGTLPSTPAYTAFVSNNVANNSVDLVITSGPIPPNNLTWNGTNAATGLPDGT